MLDLTLEFRDEFQRIIGVLVCLAALRWGGGPERLVALVWLVIFELGDVAYHMMMGPGVQWSDLDVGHAIIDVTATLLLVAIALQANRMYTLWVAAFQLVATTAHLAREIAVMMKPIAYAILAISPSYFQLALLLAGLVYHVRRKRDWGEYRDWRVAHSVQGS